ncbi:MAG: bifunctional UDP-N-acetylglucosamine diphosphorylase/glucosamine-1-phosphate N-acetyltransferase GlmU [Holosporales bacterium]|nr:bifunctional UDP-N-acetylglucosamine diphosphorylase/glucosamine-1-phosphate N-acetyltransferase GlmU [Holosporales bacterium]
MFSRVFCVILAAGKGMRLRSSLPKALHPIGGLPLIGHCLRTAYQLGVLETTLVISPDLPLTPWSEELGIPFSSQIQDPPRGTGEAVCIALKDLPSTAEWVLVLYGDTPLIPSEILQSLLSKAQENPKTGVVVLAMRPQEAAGYARLIETPDRQGLMALVESEEVRSDTQSLPLCNAGLLLHRTVATTLIPRIRPRQGREIFLTDIVALAHAEGWHNTYVEGSSAHLRGANTRMDLAALEQTFQEEARQRALRAGVTLMAPETVFFSYDTYLAADVTVFPHVFFGKGVQVESRSRIGPFCVLEGVSVGQNASIGPFARLRPGTCLEEGVRIGNFVETKNAYVAAGTKINHLSYIGDASLGEKCNIGAGTITCNYDGQHKHKTTLGDRVFVGSNTALVAPVCIAKEAVIGAGSTITGDIPEGALGLTRTDLKIVPEFHKRRKTSRSLTGLNHSKKEKR